MVSNPAEAAIQVSFDSAGTGSTQADIESVTRSIFSFKGAVLAAGAALGWLSSRALANSVRSFRDFEEQMVEVAKVSDMAGTDLLDLGDGIRGLSTELPTTAEGLAEITAAAGRMGVRGKDNLIEFTRVMGEVETATVLTADEAGTLFGKVLTQTGEPVTKLRNVASAVNELSNNFNATSEDIVQASNRSAASLRFLGLQTSEILALNAAVAAFSDSAERGGSRLRRLGQQLQDPRTIDKLAESFGLTGQQMRSLIASDPGQFIRALAAIKAEGGPAAEIIEEVFSSASNQALSVLAADAEGVARAFELSSGQMENATSLSNEVDRALDSLSAQLDLTRNLLHDIFIEIGQFLAPIIRRMLGFIQEGLRAFREWNEASNGLYGTLILTTVAVGGLALALGALISLFGGAALINDFAKALRSPLLRSVGRLLGVVLLLYFAFRDRWPLIKSIIEDVVTFVTPFIDRLIGAFNQAKDAVNGFVDTLDRLTGGRFSEGLNIAGEIFALAVAFIFIRKHIGAAISILVRFGAFIVRMIPGASSVIWALNIAFKSLLWAIRGLIATRGLAAVFTRLLGPIGLLITAIWLLWEAWQHNFLGIRELVGDWADAIVDRFEDVQARFGRLGKRLAVLGDEFKKTFDFWAEIVDDTLTTIAETIEEFLAKLNIDFNFPTLRNALRSFNQFAIAIWEFTWDVMLGIVEGWLDLIITSLSILLAFLRGDWARAHELAIGFVRRTWRGLTEFFDKWVKDWVIIIGGGFVLLAEAVSEGIAGIVNWLLTDAAGDVFDAGKGLGTALRNAVTGAVEGLVTYFETDGGADIVEGVRAFLWKVQMTLLSLPTIIQDATRDGVAAFVDYITGDGPGEAVDGLREFLWKIQLGLLSLPELFNQAAKDAVSSLVEYISSGQAETDAVASVDFLVGVMETAFLEFPPKALTAAKDAILGIDDWVRTEGWNIMVGVFTWLVDLMLAPFKGFYEGLIGASIIPDTFEDIDDYIRNTGGPLLKSAFKNALSTVKDTVSTWAGRIKTQLQGIIDKLKEVGNTKVKDPTGGDPLFRDTSQDQNLDTNPTSSGVGGAGTSSDGNVTLEGGFTLSQNDYDRIFNTNQSSEMESFGGLTAFAHGGIVNQPVRGLVGEAGPEAVVPLRKLTPMLTTALMDAVDTGMPDFSPDPTVVEPSLADITVETEASLDESLVDRLIQGLTMAKDESVTNNFTVTVEANSAEGGRAAADALERELLSNNFY